MFYLKRTKERRKVEKSKKTLNFEEIREIFSKETNVDLEGIKRIFSRPESLRKTKKLWSGKTE
jgi:hypothetical protein